MWNQIGKTVFLCVVGGLFYCVMESLWRGYTHWSMFFLAGFLSLPLDQINEHLSWDMPIWMQALLGGISITIAELAAGLVLNVWLGFNVWDYSHLSYDFMGQICPQYSALWVLLAGVGIVIFDFLRWRVFGEEMPRYKW